MGEVVMFPGTDELSVPGALRPDMAAPLRRIAKLAEKGKLESLVLIAIGPETSINLLSTPELNFHEVLGAMEALKPEIIERKGANRKSLTTYEPSKS